MTVIPPNQRSKRHVCAAIRSVLIWPTTLAALAVSDTGTRSIMPVTARFSGPTPRSRSSSSLNSRLRRWGMNCLQRAFAVLPFRRGGRQSRSHRGHLLELAESPGLRFQRGQKVVGPVLDVVV
jgi:hypothetical protein